MKIRIKGNSIRFRLTRTEVETFCREGVYTEQTCFDYSTFNYQLSLKKGIMGLQAEFQNNTITLLVPKEVASVWAVSSKVGYENTITTKEGTQLHLLLEKDFVCMDQTTEDQSDNYPNPKANL